VTPGPDLTGERPGAQPRAYLWSEKWGTKLEAPKMLRTERDEKWGGDTPPSQPGSLEQWLNYIIISEGL